MSPDQPLVSVVMCTFNGEAYLALQLCSILQQTYSKIEILLSDDASTDRTVALVREFADSDERIRFYQNPTNLGFNKNFEQTLLLARGEWIAIADQDDIWLPDKIETLVQLITPDAQLIHSYNAEFHNNDASQLSFSRSRLRFEGRDTRKLLLYNTVTGHTLLLRKAFLGFALPFPNDMFYDWWLGVIASLHSNVLLCKKVLVLHRQHEGNASQQRTTDEAFFRSHAMSLQSLQQIKQLNTRDVDLLKQLIGLITHQRVNRFSLPVFFFFLRHAKSAFYYRKKRPMWFYYLKYSFQKATMKQKYWP